MWRGERVQSGMGGQFMSHATPQFRRFCSEMIIANAHFSRDIMVLPTTVCCSPPASLSPAAQVRRAAAQVRRAAAISYLRRATAAYVQRRRAAAELPYTRHMQR